LLEFREEDIIVIRGKNEVKIGRWVARIGRLKLVSLRSGFICEIEGNFDSFYTKADRGRGDCLIPSICHNNRMLRIFKIILPG